MSPPINIVGYDPTRGADAFSWDQEAADWVSGFFPECLTHVNGFAGQFDLLPWQRDIVATLFGWKRANGTRRYSEAFIAVPRKNGKTALVAGLGLYLMECDGEPMAQVYCAAGSRDQATMVFSAAQQMVRASPQMSDIMTIHSATKHIVSHRTSGTLKAIPADAALEHGKSPSGVLFDELHTQPTRDLYDVLRSARGARFQASQKRGSGGPLFISITTAGHDRHSICWEVWDYARKVRDGIIDDPHFLPVIYELGEGDDWSDRSVWARLNPNLGVSLSADFLEQEFKLASEVPAYENTFRNLYLNQWTEQAVRWLPMDAWDRCGDELPMDLQGVPCWAGLDLSTTQDITALVLAFRLEGRIGLECHFFVPADSIRKRSDRDRVPYEQWAKEGWITATPGNVVDYDFVRSRIEELSRKYRIRQIAFDRWNSSQLMSDLGKQNAPLLEFGQGFADMTAPSKELERRVVEGSLMHGRNPVLRWMASNVAIRPDAAGNIKPDKEHSTERIDGIVAAIMAIGAMTRDMTKPSPYMTRGIRTT